MKRKLAFVFLLMVLGAIGYLGFTIYKELQAKQALEKRIAELPDFSAPILNGEILHSDTFSKQSPLILTYFNTKCQFCQAEIRSIRQHKNLQAQADIYLISDESPNALKQFADEFELDSLKHISVLQDSTKQLKELFGVTGVPTTFVYNNDGKLLKNFKGETKAEALYKLVK
jgi:peroxiredoxin